MEPMTTEGHLLHALRRFHEVAPPQHVRQLQMRHEIQSLQFWRATIGECLATFFLTFLVCAAVVPWGGATGAAVALTAGFVATTLNHCFGHVSGGYMNPAVTLAFVTLRKMTVFRGALYIVAQCGGAIAGAALLY
ncbi:PREDICTED: neurogenic protein big brain-like, partial [Priapulus caudatus]|uniref:Neurogenic protein big brain-like n=1 Tax=Priapulus caudatus TaxID=37621 RepID=A0ABM1ESJ8_PRICU